MTMIRTFHFDVACPDPEQAVQKIRDVISVIAPHVPTLHGAVVMSEPERVRMELKVAGQKGYLLATNAKHMAGQILIKAGINPKLAVHTDTSRDRNKRDLYKEEGRNMGERRRGRNPVHDRTEWQGDDIEFKVPPPPSDVWIYVADDH